MRNTSDKKIPADSYSRTAANTAYREEKRRFEVEEEARDDGLGGMIAIMNGIMIMSIIFGAFALLILTAGCSPRCPTGYWSEGGSCLAVKIESMR